MTPEISTMFIGLSLILLVLGYIVLIQSVNHIIERNTYAYDNLLLIDVVLGVMYLIVILFVGLLYVFSGYNLYIPVTGLSVVVVLALLAFGYYCRNNRIEIRKNIAVIFLVYIVLVLFVTIFARLDMGNGIDPVAEKPFYGLLNAIAEGNLDLLLHYLMNIVMFIPLGCLIPALNPDYFEKWSFAVLSGLMLSIVIECLQLVFVLGQSDVIDVIMNTLGAGIGYIMFELSWRTGKNWRL